MSSSSEESLLDFSSGSSDLYQPSNTSDSDSVDLSDGDQNIKKKRKVRNEQKWKRNERKRKLAEGKRYINSTGVEIGPRVTGSECNCKYRCFYYVNVEMRGHILKKFNKLGEKHKQDLYLSGLIKSAPVVRRRPNQGASTKGQIRNVSNVYSIRLGTFDKKVCKKAFASIHGISMKRVENVASQKISNDFVTVKSDKRGKHHNRPNRITEDLKKQVDNHIQSFPRRVSHYSRKDSSKYYLSPDLNVKLMHRLYLQQYEPEMYHKLMDGDKAGYRPKVSHDFYFRYLKANFNYTFGCPRSDTCVKCDELENQIKNSNLSPDQVQNAKVQKQLHLLKAEVFYRKLKENSSIALEKPEVEVLSFDYQQNFPLPKVPSGDAFYCRQLWLYNFCIHSAKTKRAHCYMFDETTGSKKPDETISFIDHYLCNVLNQNVSELILFSDNCCAQNKNYAIVQYLFSLVKSGRFKKITHHFPIPGHSFLPCDRCFGVIEKKLKLIERVFHPNEYHTHVRNSSKMFHTVFVSQDLIHNYTAALSPLSLKQPLDQNGEKFLVTKYRVFEYDVNHIDEVWVTKGMDLGCNPVQKYRILKGTKSDSPNRTTSNDVYPVFRPVDRRYLSCLKMKANKYKDVMSLVTKFVPQSDMEYYRALPNNDAVINGNDDESTDDQDEDLN